MIKAWHYNNRNIDIVSNFYFSIPFNILYNIYIYKYKLKYYCYNIRFTAENSLAINSITLKIFQW